MELDYSIHKSMRNLTYISYHLYRVTDSSPAFRCASNLQCQTFRCRRSMFAGFSPRRRLKAGKSYFRNEVIDNYMQAVIDNYIHRKSGMENLSWLQICYIQLTA